VKHPLSSNTCYLQLLEKLQIDPQEALIQYFLYKRMYADQKIERLILQTKHICKRFKENININKF
jgi:bacterioferritin (cytochrome b1)